jgi:hypothetical protein
VAASTVWFSSAAMLALAICLGVRNVFAMSVSP